MNGADPRLIAERVLLRVLRDAAYASASLDGEFEKHPQLAERDRALATELVYGTLRTYNSLYAELERGAKKGLKKSDFTVIVPLILAAYQVLLLDRVPEFAAVDAAVNRVKQVRGDRVAGFANALLRKLQRGSLLREQAVYQNLPAWLRASLEASLGPAQAAALAGAHAELASERASTCIRLSRATELPDALQNAAASTLMPGAYRLQHSGDPRKLPEYRAGRFSVQEEGAQFIARALDVKPGERVWDTCAGRGQKSAQLAEMLADSGKLVVSDLHPSKLEALSREFTRLGLHPAESHALDLTMGSGDLVHTFDKILVDAPCTGTGTLRRRPEILLRLTQGDPARLAGVSELILRNVAKHMHPASILVFAVCSVLPEECETVVSRVSELLEPVPFAAEAVRQQFGEVSAFRLLPGVQGTDGYFAACLRLRASA